MRISIFGLGYVGVVTAACLARDGHEVIGVDVNSNKVALVNSGHCPIVEPGLGDLLAGGVQTGKIRATTDSAEAVASSDLSLISVGTPSSRQGSTDLTYVHSVCKEIGAAIHQQSKEHVVVLRSTVPPGTLKECQDIFENVAKFMPVHLAFNPEFLREGSAIKDYNQPPYTIIGTSDPVAEGAVRKMYAAVEAPVIVIKPETAEMVKFVANTWHAAKVSFANEIGRVARGFGIDGHEVMEIIVRDTKLNISPTYMRPGFAYGGSCLPKDVSALLYCARMMDTPAPLLQAIPVTNNLQIELVAQRVLQAKVRRIALLGLAFKPETDDLRESPSVVLAKRLLGEGCEIKIYDLPVYEAKLMGTNLAYIKSNLPHFEDLLVATPEEAIQSAELVIVAHSTSKIREFVYSSCGHLQVLDVNGAL
ncbi:MAG: UDP-glucose 6-dehydrogenase [Leptolyngbya sp.]|nr:MAG: UDP-glucose 6-dehydrogenase [Leptolyngbya sp.]